MKKRLEGPASAMKPVQSSVEFGSAPTFAKKSVGFFGSVEASTVGKVLEEVNINLESQTDLNISEMERCIDNKS